MSASSGKTTSAAPLGRGRGRSSSAIRRALPAMSPTARVDLRQRGAQRLEAGALMDSSSRPLRGHAATVSRACTPARRTAARLEQAVAVAAGGPDALVVEQGLVEHHGQVVPEGRHAADREAGGRADLVRRWPGGPRPRRARRPAVGVHAVGAGGDAEHRVAVGHEHQRLGDLGLVAAHAPRPPPARWRWRRPGAGRPPQARACEPASIDLLAHSYEDTDAARGASVLSSTPAASASSASDS